MYTTYSNVNLLTNLTDSDVVNADVTSLITQATAQLNSDINIDVIRERVSQIDDTRKNEINGTNTIYYVRNWNGKFLADRDNDGSIGTGDVVVYQVASDGTETKLTVSSIDADDCYVTLSTAPSSGVSLYMTYQWSYADEATPNKNVELACGFLTAAFCYEKINRGLSPQQVFGNIRLMRDMEAGNSYYKRYRDMVNKINASMGDYAEARVF